MFILNKINLLLKILFYQIIQIILKRELKFYIEIEYQFKLSISILCNKTFKKIHYNFNKSTLK